MFEEVNESLIYGKKEGYSRYTSYYPKIFERSCYYRDGKMIEGSKVIFKGSVDIYFESNVKDGDFEFKIEN